MLVKSLTPKQQEWISWKSEYFQAQCPQRVWLKDLELDS